MARQSVSGTASVSDPPAILSPVSHLLTGLESHKNAPAGRINPSDLPAALDCLRTDAGLDHLACVTAQQYTDRYESIYHLRSYDDPTREASLVVPTSRQDPCSVSGASVFSTASWHEREAYDLVGITYKHHPDLRRILLPETWQGHPLTDDYNQDQSQIVTLREQDGAIHEAVKTDESDGEAMFLNIGPHHPATHGVMHLKVTLDGETVAGVDPDIGYIHRCEEQMCEQGTYRYQIMPYPDRWDWSGGGLLNEWAYARVAEDLTDINVPEYAKVIRTLSAELSRILAHMLAIGAYALDVIGDFTATFMYAIQERERVQELLEDLTGQRLMFNYFRLGGVVWDLPEPRQEFIESVRTFLDGLPRRLQDIHNLLTSNEIIQARTVGTGVLDKTTAKDYGVTGPVARGSGIDYDLRRDDSYGYYDKLDWNVVTEPNGDNYSRLLVRLQEVEESATIIEQCIDLLEEWPDDDRTIQSNVPRTIKPDDDTEIYRAVEAAKGELGIYIRADGTDTPGRFKIRGPSFSNLQALPEMATGGTLADLIATLGSLDTIMGEVDR